VIIVFVNFCHFPTFSGEPTESAVLGVEPFVVT